MFKKKIKMGKRKTSINRKGGNEKDVRNRYTQSVRSYSFLRGKQAIWMLVSSSHFLSSILIFELHLYILSILILYAITAFLTTLLHFLHSIIIHGRISLLHTFIKRKCFLFSNLGLGSIQHCFLLLFKYNSNNKHHFLLFALSLLLSVTFKHSFFFSSFPAQFFYP